MIHSPLFALFPFLTAIYKAAPFWLVFAIGLLQAQWTYTGYDASAHVAEETIMARKNSAWGVFLSVAVSAVVGYVVLHGVDAGDHRHPLDRRRMPIPSSRSPATTSHRFSPTSWR